jgi:dephospho-CoA kinase
MKIIALTGSMGSGKSTAVQHFKELYLQKQVNVFKFAEPLYQIQEFAYRTIQKVYPKPDNFIKDRKLLQWLGTQWGRELDQNLWVNLWRAEVTYAQENYPQSIALCDDCRFDNEAKTIKSMGGVIIKLTSTDAQNRIATANGLENHKSEAGIDKKYVDFVIDNSYTLDIFKNDLEEVFKQIMK